MQIKVNSMYQTPDGSFLIPRSHESGGKGEQYAIFEILHIGNNGHYTKTHCTLTKKEIKKRLGLAKNEKVVIV